MLRSKKATEQEVILVTIMNQSHLVKSGFEEDTVIAGDTSNASRSRDKICSTTQNLWSFGSINPFTGDLSEVDTRDTPCEQGFYANCSLGLIQGNHPLADGRLIAANNFMTHLTTMLDACDFQMRWYRRHTLSSL
jgi:hypothetical protein